MNQTKTRTLWRRSTGDNPGLAWLFLSLLFFLLSYPLVADRPAGSLVLDVLFSAMLVISAYAVSAQRKILIVALVLALPTLGFWWSVRATDSTSFAFTGLALSAIFFLFILFVLLRNVINSDEANIDTIYAAMSAYLLIGVTWSFFYAMVEISTPGAFQFGSLAMQLQNSQPHGELRLFSYYSLVTLSTLGYGDITPLTPLAQTLSALEAVTGQLFIAVLLARLVGMHIAQKQRN